MSGLTSFPALPLYIGVIALFIVVQIKKQSIIKDILCIAIMVFDGWVINHFYNRFKIFVSFINVLMGLIIVLFIIASILKYRMEKYTASKPEAKKISENK